MKNKMKCNSRNTSNTGIYVQGVIVNGSNSKVLFSGDDFLLHRIKDTIMESDLPPAVKVKVYNLIQEASKHNELEMED